ncbi:MAG: YgjP-like metallopeptidase domain-containing protein [Bacilli bacterium]
MTIVLGETTYPVTIFYRERKRIILRFKDGQFIVSMPKRTSPTWLRSQLQLHGEKLIKKVSAIPAGFNEKGIYLYGEWVALNTLAGQFEMDPPIPFAYWEKRWQPLKDQFTKSLKHRVQFWQNRLNIFTHYQVRVRHMTTRLGSNSRKTKRLTFAYKLVHFAWPIIDAVIVHELIHDRHFDHSPKFYQALTAAYPTYHLEHGKILKGQYQ